MMKECKYVIRKILNHKICDNKIKLIEINIVFLNHKICDKSLFEIWFIINSFNIIKEFIHMEFLIFHEVTNE